MQSPNSNTNTSHASTAQTSEDTAASDASASEAQPTFDPADSFEPITEEDFIAVLFGLRGPVTYEEIFGDAVVPPGPTVPRSLEEVLRELEYAEFSVALQAAYDATFGRPAAAQAAVAADNTQAASETQGTATQDVDQPMDEDQTVSTGQ